MRKNRFADLKKYFPNPSELEDLSDYDVYVLTNNVVAGKFVKCDKLTDEEKEVFAKKLNDEWVETIVEPYTKAFYEFCEKYEIAVFESEISLGVSPLDKYAMFKMLEDMSSKLLGRG